MTRSKRIEPVARLADNDERSAARALGESQQRLNEAEARLQELIDYREQYARQFTTRGRAGLQGSRLQDYRAFLTRLDEAIAHQRDVVQRCHRELDSQRQHWVDRSTHAKALNKVVERYRHREHVEAAQREQRESDDFNGRSGARSRGRSGGE